MLLAALRNERSMNIVFLPKELDWISVESEFIENT